MISLLVAYAKNTRIIGNQGSIPWKISSERDRFKKICNGRFVIMGRKSFDEIGHALPYCTIIIVSKRMKKAPDGCLLANSFESAVSMAKVSNTEVLVAGGAQIYETALPLAEKIYATEVDVQVEGDTFFPKLSENWKETYREHISTDSIPYDYVTFVKSLQ